MVKDIKKQEIFTKLMRWQFAYCFVRTQLSPNKKAPKYSLGLLISMFYG